MIMTIEKDGIPVKAGMSAVNNILALTATVLVKNVLFTLSRWGLATNVAYKCCKCSVTNAQLRHT